MRFPLSLTTTWSATWPARSCPAQKRFPLVLMLEPLHACNLTCTGCGRIREYAQTIKEKLTVEECLASVDEAGAPIVSICGGEPMIYPEIGELVRGILKRRKHIYLCTNGMFIKKKLHEFRPTQPLLLQRPSRRPGRNARHGRRARGRLQGRRRGHHGRQEGRLPRLHQHDHLQGNRPGRDRRLFAYLTELGVDGFMLSPAYGYAAVKETNPNGAAEIFMTRDDIRAKFQEAQKLLTQVPA